MAEGDRIVEERWVDAGPVLAEHRTQARQWVGHVEADRLHRKWWAPHCGDVIGKMNADLGEKPVAEYVIRE